MSIIENKKSVFIIISVFTTILIVVGLIVFAKENSERITNENIEYLSHNSKQTAENIDNAISEGYDNIKILSALVSNSLTGPEFDISSIQGLIKDSVFDFMEFADKDGMDHNITGGVSDATDRKYYLDAKAGNTGMELIYVSRATHETLLMFYSPIYYEDEFVGSLVGVYQASNKITHLLSTEYFGEPVVAYLANNDGRIIAGSQVFDPRDEMYIFDLANGNENLVDEFNRSLKTGEAMMFSVEARSTGGCMRRLPKNGWYLVQMFPQKATNRMVSNANKLAYNLATFLIVVAFTLLVSLIKFYKLQQEQVEMAKNQAEMANLAKTNFLFNMSHDIRTPMNAIIGYNKMALKNIDDKEKVRDSLIKTSRASNMLLSLINSILDMSRIESGKAELDEKNADIYKSFYYIETTMLELAKTKDIDLIFEFGNIINRYVMIDYDRITRVFTNIISNSIKYTNEGGHIKVSCEQMGEAKDGYATYKYTFADDGIGMSEEFQKHIFEEFTREENSTTSGIQGTGLGLAVVKSFVDLMNGSVECTSKQGVGTTFSVTIPLRLQEGTLTVETDDYDENDNKEYGFNFNGLKILLCEDNELNREIAADVLEEQGIKVEEAVNGQEAVELLKEKGPDYYDFILMDIQMPIMDGYEATKEIRAMYPDSGIPIIALSANAFSEDKAASLASGMDNHIAKPINTMELFSVLYKYI